MASLSTNRLAAVDFVRGDANQDSEVNLTDTVQLIRFLFREVEIGHGRCLDALDVDDSGAINVTDALRLLRYLFGFPGQGSTAAQRFF